MGLPDVLDKLDSLKEGLEWGFKDFTSYGAPKRGLELPFALDDNVAYEKSPALYNFYMQLMEGMNEDPKMVETLFGTELMSRHQREELKNRLNRICSSLTYIKDQPEDIQTKLKAKISTALKRNDLTKGIKVDDLLKNDYCGLDLNPIPAENKTDVKADSKNPSGNRYDTFFREKLLQLDKKQSGGARYWTGDMDKVLTEMEVDSRHSLENENITTTDKFVFLAITFIIRGVTLYLIEWGISTRFIDSFQKAFIYYFFIYNSLFVLVAMMVNMGDSLFMEMMFFYMSTRHGIGRIGTHLAIQVVLLPIPFLVNEKKVEGENEPLSFEQRIALQGSINQFSLFIWLFTSFVAFMY